jgi:hypothetical protein
MRMRFDIISDIERELLHAHGFDRVALQQQKSFLGARLNAADKKRERGSPISPEVARAKLKFDYKGDNKIHTRVFTRATNKTNKIALDIVLSVAPAGGKREMQFLPFKYIRGCANSLHIERGCISVLQKQT